MANEPRFSYGRNCIRPITVMSGKALYIVKARAASCIKPCVYAGPILKFYNCKNDGDQINNLKLEIDVINVFKVVNAFSALN